MAVYRVERHEFGVDGRTLRHAGTAGTAWISSDGRLLIELNPDELQRAGNYYTIRVHQPAGIADPTGLSRHSHDPGYSEASGRRDSLYGPRKRPA